VRRRAATLAPALIAIAVLTLAFLAISRIAIGDYAKYGKVDVGDSAVLHLPAGSVAVGLAKHEFTFNGRTPDISVPGGLTLNVVSAASGGAAATVRRDEEASPSGYSDSKANVEVRLWRLQVPRDGDYRVTSGGDAGPSGELVFGGGPTLSAGYVWLVAGILWLAVLVAGLLGETRGTRGASAR
jgi:hypothetical protein